MKDTEKVQHLNQFRNKQKKLYYFTEISSSENHKYSTTNKVEENFTFEYIHE